MTPEQLRAEIAKDDATLEEVQKITTRYQRHTVDITGPAPKYVEDEMIAFERGWKRAPWMWVILGLFVLGYVVWRVVNGGGQ